MWQSKRKLLGCLEGGRCPDGSMHDRFSLREAKTTAAVSASQQHGQACHEQGPAKSAPVDALPRAQIGEYNLHPLRLPGCTPHNPSQPNASALAGLWGLEHAYSLRLSMTPQRHATLGCRRSQTREQAGPCPTCTLRPWPVASMPRWLMSRAVTGAAARKLCMALKVRTSQTCSQAPGG